MIKQNQRYFNFVFIILDWVVYFLCLLMAWAIRFRSGLFERAVEALTKQEYMFALIFIIPIYFLIYNFFGLYKPHRIKSSLNEFFNILRANLLGMLVIVTVLFVDKNINYSRNVLLMFFAFNTVFNTLERLAVRQALKNIRKKGFNLKHVIIIGNNELSREYINRVEKNKQWGFNVLGLFDDNNSITINNLPFMGSIDNLDGYLKNKLIDEVIIALQLDEYGKLGGIVDICEKYGVYSRIIPDYIKFIPAKPHIENIEGLAMISLREIPLKDNLNVFIKRLVDIVGSLAGIILFAIPMLIISILIKCNSDGPIIFKQERIGLNRKPFLMYKFRTMKVQNAKEEVGKWTTQNDNRVTKVGSFLRKTSLDELPQLFNVLAGSMSLVGPRPERPHFVEKFMNEIPGYMVKHSVRPGMSGWAQINGLRGDTSIEKRIEYDLYYIENWTLSLDIKILVSTVFTGFVNKNAY